MSNSPDANIFGRDSRVAEQTSETIPPLRRLSDETLKSLLARINALADQASGPTGPRRVEAPFPDTRGTAPVAAGNSFIPIEPSSFQEAQLTESEIEALALKYLLARGDLSGRTIADQIKLPFVLLDELLRRMKNDQLIAHRSSAPMNDYQYQLTDLGRERARRLAEHCSYFGSAPVSLKDYVAGVQAQSITRQRPSPESLRDAFNDLQLSQRMLDRLGPAINSGRGLFLFGSPGNGKTSIAQRVTRAFGHVVWIPRAIGIDGEVIRLFDPVNHEELPLEAGGGLLDQRMIDKRWVRIRRPTIIAGGELTMSALEVTINTSTGVSEAPLQLKSNCGTLVIDDFGRQRVRVEELLNRWIVPLEMRVDFLNLPNGKKITVPFDQLIIFSTNLEPKELVDEAFLRRVPYKIEVVDPTEQDFRELFAKMAQQLGFPDRPDMIDYLIQTHYRKARRPFRFCQPRDLLLQVRNYCTYRNEPLDVKREYLDMAAENYFAVM
jgi:DNA-binding PadR family transcriptional regulator